jgi:hypothetical protein
MTHTVIWRHAWLQKHPSPTHAGRDFHWHPDTVPGSVRGRLAELAAAAGRAPASLWLVTGEHVAWARTFAATAPGERRGYTGIAAVVADRGGRDPAEMLASAPAAGVGPFAGEPLATRGSLARLPPLAPVAGALARLVPAPDGTLARAVLQDGNASAADPGAAELAGLLAALLTWLPDDRGRDRSGAFTAAATPAVERDPARRNLVHYLTRCWYSGDAGHGARTWALVLDLAARAGDLATAFSRLTRVAEAWETAAELEAFLRKSEVLPAELIARCDAQAPAPLRSAAARDAGWLWNRVLHYWGRGFLDHAIAERLADTLATRVVADHLFHLDRPDAVDLPQRYLRRLQYEALLPAAGVEALRSAVSRRIPTLTGARGASRG